MTDAIKPTTIIGIKRLAKSISRMENLSHSTALDHAASAAGFSNYTHAKRSLASVAAVVPIKKVSFTTYISISDEDKKTGEVKTYVLEIELPKPIDDFLVQKDFRGGGNFRAFSRTASDHISYRPSYLHGDVATELCEAARKLQFIAITGLRHCQSWDIPGSINSLPDKDHRSTWFDPATGKGFFVDEPYGDHRDHERQKWADENGFEMGVTGTWGIYKPRQCRMYLFSRRSDGLPLAPIMKALKNADSPVTNYNWKVSAVSGSRFTSPQQIASRAAAKAARAA